MTREPDSVRAGCVDVSGDKFGVAYVRVRALEIGGGVLGV